MGRHDVNRSGRARRRLGDGGRRPRHRASEQDLHLPRRLGVDRHGYDHADVRRCDEGNTRPTSAEQGGATLHAPRDLVERMKTYVKVSYATHGEVADYGWRSDGQGMENRADGGRAVRRTTSAC